MGGQRLWLSGQKAKSAPASGRNCSAITAEMRRGIAATFPTSFDAKAGEKASHVVRDFFDRRSSGNIIVYRIKTIMAGRKLTCIECWTRRRFSNYLDAVEKPTKNSVLLFSRAMRVSGGRFYRDPAIFSEDYTYI